MTKERIKRGLGAATALMSIASALATGLFGALLVMLWFGDNLNFATHGGIVLMAGAVCILVGAGTWVTARTKSLADYHL